MNLESLLLLLSVTQHSNKRKASEALNTSVDTINKYIDSLEQDLCQKLLYSDSRGTNLTENGKKIIESAAKIKEILNDVYSATSCNSDAQKEYIGEVKIAMTVGVDSSLKASAVGDFFDRYPDIKITATTTHDSPKLDDMAYDIGITYDEPSSQDVVILYRHLVKCAFFASPDYLDKHGYPHDMNDMLEKHRLVSKSTNCNYIKGWKENLRKAKHLNFVSNSSFSINEAIMNGIGIGVMPLAAKKTGVVCLDNIPCDCPLTFYIFAHKTVKDIPRVRAVINLCRNLLEKMDEL